MDLELLEFLKDVLGQLPIVFRDTLAELARRILFAAPLLAQAGAAGSRSEPLDELSPAQGFRHA
jgi:hypothetical protein